MSESKRPLRRGLVQAVVVLILLAVGGAGAAFLMKSAPKASRKAAEPPARLVETVPARMGDHPTPVTAMGSVRAAQEATLYPEVAGRIVAVGDNFIPGGRVAKGELLLRLQDADYRLAVRQREAKVAQAEAALEREFGQQEVARREYQLLGEDLPPEERALVLRRPQLASAKADLAEAKAALDQARLDLSRTEVRAPFDGVITGRSVALGSRVTTGTAMLTLVATDTFWVRVDLPVDALKWLEVPEDDGGKGTTVTLRRSDWPQGEHRTGRVLRLIPSLEREARLAQLLVAVPDPLAQEADNRGKPRLLVNDYVEATLAGRTLEGVVALDRALLRGGDRVWILEDGKLVIREVEVAFRGPSKVLIAAGVEDGDEVVATELATPVPGMALRTAEAARDGGPQ
ncbi:MAG TPA: efflux RND transporter periplasmic adaptor subunit [Gammaproteobacteria bacterium]|nr:efflux RND transporter periplasmic adaptor subunit [Gammaproteobacteria bacterium]